MIRSTLFAAVLSLTTFSVASALPSVANAPMDTTGSVVRVGYDHGHYKGHKNNWNKYHSNNWNKYHGNNWNKYHGNNWKYHNRYHYAGRYWGHRYSYRPYGWATLGCVAVGPIWYCP